MTNRGNPLTPRSALEEVNRALREQLKAVYGRLAMQQLK